MNHGLFFIIHLEKVFNSTPGTGKSKHHFPHFTYLFSRKDAMTHSKSVAFQFSFFTFHLIKPSSMSASLIPESSVY